MHSIEYTQRQQNISNNWRTIKRKITSHAYATIQMPLVDKRTINLRKPGYLEGIHEKIYLKLGVNYKSLPTLKTVAK